MPEKAYPYIIVGGGLAGASAVEGIREIDQNGEILLVGAEEHQPYDRPPLTKKLWWGKKQVKDIFLHEEKFYQENGVTLALGKRIEAVAPREHLIRDQQWNQFQYGKLLLATGGVPRRLDIPGGDLENVCYYRTLDDYQRSRQAATAGASILLIGGGFIGSEMAASLQRNQVQVTMIFPGEYLCQRVFPRTLGLALQGIFQERGIRILAGDAPAAISLHNGKLQARTKKGQTVEADFVIAGLGVEPEIALARSGNLLIEHGIKVDDHLATSDEDIYAAGDNAWWFSPLLQRFGRVEHWDNALNQGKHAGRNMAGAYVPFDYQPYFFSDLFEFGYEAVGLCDARLETYADWQQENRRGVIYYQENGKVVGVMLWDIYGQVDAARGLIRQGIDARPEVLAGMIK